MKLDEIKSIVKLMSENDLTEFKIESEDMHLCIRRGSSAGAPAAAPAPVVQPQAIPAIIFNCLMIDEKYAHHRT